ncbi:hypothetical protein LXA43DRAFT_1094004 [Ganoderma leucocontextum]|nr:hypothetical protein LXA43DRAFT_1094004 [Ganoderma leucocontextum]
MLGRPSTDTEDDDDYLAPYRRPILRKVIDESKKSANALATTEERDVQRAIELSKEEEEERRKRLVALAERGVFDDTDFVGLTGTAPLIDLDAQQEVLQQEYAQQRAELARQQMETQSAAAAAQQAQLPGLLQQQQQQRPLVPQPTAFGSNNPFVASPPTGLWYGDLADSLDAVRAI